MINEDQPMELSLRERNLRVALLNTLLGAIKVEVDSARSELLQELLGRFDDDGTTKFTITLPGSTKPLGSITLPLPAATQGVDELAFLAWAKEEAPHLLTEVVIPAQEEQRIVDFDKKARTAFLNDLLLDEDEGIYHTADGLLPLGISYTAGGRPKSLTVTLPAASKERLLAAYRAGELEHIEAGIPLNPVAIADQRDIPPWEREE